MFKQYGAACLLALWVALAVVLRFQQLDVQWLIDDEWHAVHRLLSGERWRELLFAVGVADFSVPQTLFYKFLARYMVVDEVVLRAPMLTAGMALVLGGAWWMWRARGVLEASLFGGLLALSPVLIYQSRNARPYAITLFLAWVALWALARWRSGQDGRFAVLYVVCAVSACWFHAAVAPFVLLPLVWVWGEGVLSGLRGGAWLAAWRTTAVGGATALGVGALTIWPAWLNRDLMATRTGMDLPSFETLIGFFHLLAGHESAWAVGALLLSGVWGGWLAWRAREPLAGLAVVGVAGVLLSIVVMRPAWVQHPMTFGRYVLPAWPLALGCVALGVADLFRRLRNSGRGWRALAPLLMIVPLIGVSGEIVREVLRAPGSLMLHSWYWFDLRPGKNPVRADLGGLPRSPFWDELGKRAPGSVKVAVAGHALESYTLADVVWLGVHRQRLLSGQRQGLCGGPPYAGEVGRGMAKDGRGLRLRNAVDLADDEALLQAEIDYVAFNRNLFPGRGLEVLDIETCIEKFRVRHGGPVFEDPYLVVFSVDHLSK